MHGALAWNRRAQQTWWGRSLCGLLGIDSAVLGFLPTLFLLACGPDPLAPSAGLPEYEEIAAIPIPGPARVNVAGGNLLVMRTDLDLDTQLGPFSVGAVWNSATQRWTWSFDDISYAGGTFVDTTGASYSVGPLAPGAAIPGTIWVKVSQYGQSGPNTLKTKGGLEYDFTTTGHPLYVRWTSSSNPYLRFTETTQGDGKLHTTAIDQCMPAPDCRAVFAIGYDGQGRVASIADRAGRQALFTYDASGHLSVARDGLDVAKGWPGFRYEYASGDLSAITNSEGERVEYHYDPSHRVTQVTQIGAGNPSQLLSYGAPDSGGIYTTYFSDALSYGTNFRYDGAGQLVEVKALSTGDKVTRTWQNGRVMSLVLPSGVATSWTYSSDDVATRTDPSGNVTTFTYQSNGVDRTSPARRPVLSVADSVGSVQQRSYDAAGRLLSISNGAGEATLFGYGSDEMISQVTDPAGISTTFSGYGEHGHAASVTRAGTTRTFSYDSVGNLTQGPDMISESGPGRGGIVARTFDADRNVTSVQLANLVAFSPSQSGNLTIDYRSDHRAVQIQRPGGGDALLAYDAIGRLIQRSDRADGAWRPTTFTYDAASRMTALGRPNGMGESWSYDALGRVTFHKILRNGAQENSVSFGWSNGRLVSLADQLAGSEAYSYDTAGRVSAVDYGSGDRTEFGWDARSRLVDTTLRKSDGSVLRDLGLAYDAAGREATVTDGGVAMVQRSFASGRLAQSVYGNGLRRTFAYDATLGTLSGATMTTAGAATVESTAVQYADPSCNFGDQCITAQTSTYGALASSSYEKVWLMPAPNSNPLSAAGKRVGASQLGAQGSGDAINYDLLSDLSAGAAGSLFDYNAESNRLLDARDGVSGTVTVGYAYDAAGFYTARNGVPIAWDGAGRIASVGSSSFVWDVLGRPVSSTIAGVTTKRRFGGLVETDAVGAPRAIDLGEVRIDLAGSGTRYRHFDYRGNVKLVTDAAGNVIKHYQYSPYGIDQVFGADADTVSFARGRQVGDLFVIGHRLYDPLAARFLAPDPIYQLVNQYSYTLGNPAQFWDPSGQSPLGDAGFVFGEASVLLAGIAPFVITGSGPAAPAFAVAYAIVVTGLGSLSLYLFKLDGQTPAPLGSAPGGVDDGRGKERTSAEDQPQNAGLAGNSGAPGPKGSQPQSVSLPWSPGYASPTPYEGGCAPLAPPSGLVSIWWLLAANIVLGLGLLASAPRRR